MEERKLFDKNIVENSLFDERKSNLISSSLLIMHVQRDENEEKPGKRETKIEKEITNPW